MILAILLVICLGIWMFLEMYQVHLLKERVEELEKMINKYMESEDNNAEGSYSNN